MATFGLLRLTITTNLEYASRIIALSENHTHRLSAITLAQRREGKRFVRLVYMLN